MCMIPLKTYRLVTTYGQLQYKNINEEYKIKLLSTANLDISSQLKLDRLDTRTNFTFWLMVSIRNSLKMIDKRYFLRHTEGLFFVISSNILEVCYWICFIFWPLPSVHKHRFSLFCISRALSPSWEACGWMKVLCLLGFFVFLKKISCFCPCLYFSFSQMPLPF